MLGSDSIPVIDIRPLPGQGADAVARAIGEACRRHGFFYIVGHGWKPEIFESLDRASRAFFALPLSEKMSLSMDKGGAAWRGYFPIGAELTSGQADLKEGLYLGTELTLDHPAVQAGLPLHGPNLFPDAVPELKTAVLEYMKSLTAIAHRVMEGLALSLGLQASYFYEHYTQDPLILFRIFHYPSGQGPAKADQWGVGEHTDYGLLTILKQDSIGGLQIKSQGEWIDAPVIADSFVCNIGDMLERMTGGLYRSTLHRVKNLSGQSRFSYPFFFDPNFNASVAAIDTRGAPVGLEQDRWDHANPHSFQGTYGDYLLQKIGKVFPDLRQTVLKMP
jgi:isopenicillin N synthase-like dioxygenase